MTQYIKRVNLPMLALSIVHFIITFFTAGKMFNAPLNIAVPVPVDLDSINLYIVLTKICTFITLFLVYQLAYIVFKRRKDKAFMLNFLLPFALFLGVYIINFVICNPGLYNIDDGAMYALSRNYLPYYWQNYLISLFTMTGLTIFPFTSGQMVFTQLIVAFVIAYLFYRLSTTVEGKKYQNAKYILFIFAFMPFINLINLTTFRPYIYSILNLFVFGYLIFEKLQARQLNLLKLIGLATAFGVLAFWRSESIVYLLFAPILLYFAYNKQLKLKKAVAFIAVMLVAFGLVNIPQKIGNDKYYLNDYFIVSTTRPLSVLLNMENTYNYEGVQEDINNIARIIDPDHIKALPLTCNSYQSFNATVNEGMLSQTMSTKEQQQNYIKSYANIVLHNPLDFAKERLDCFIKTNMMENAFTVDFGKPLEQGVEPNLASYWIFSQELKIEGLVPRDVDNKDYFNFITAKNEETGFGYIYIGIPYIILSLILLVVSAIKKGWFLFFVNLSLLLREVIIFLTSPDVMIYYYMPLTVTMTFIYMLLIIFGITNIKAKKINCILLEKE